jgi:general secretion pathway protein A
MRELEDFLIQQFKNQLNVLLFIDEAQMLRGQQFELIRQITNFEANDAKLVQIILAGQNNLRNKLKLKKALLSRAATVSTLDPLTPDECREMINFRLKVAGRHEPLFTPDAYEMIYEVTHGVPREVVKVCFSSLALAGMLEVDLITGEVIQDAVQ